MKKIQTLLISRSRAKLNDLEDVLMDQAGINIIRKLISAKATDLQLDTDTTPHVCVVDMSEDWENDIPILTNLVALNGRLPLLVIGHSADPNLMRRAMKCGARDFFAHPYAEQEMIGSIRQIAHESQMAHQEGRGKITAIVNSKGGSGASFLCSSLSCHSSNSKESPKSTVVVDLDLQFGDLSVYFDLPSNDNLMQALNSAGSLDRMVMEGLVQSHPCGAGILASKPDHIRTSSDIQPQDVVDVLTVLSSTTDNVIVDLPRSLDPVCIAVLEMSDQVLCVTQQSVPHIRDTKHLITLIRDAGVTTENIRIVVNKYGKKKEIQMHDIREALPDLQFSQIPEDEKRVDFAINNGIPVPMKYPSSPVNKALKGLSDQLWPPTIKKRKGIVSRWFN